MYPGRPLYPDGKRRGIRDKLKKDRPLNGVRLQKSVFDGHDPAVPRSAPRRFRGSAGQNRDRVCFPILPCQPRITRGNCAIWMCVDGGIHLTLKFAGK